MLTIFHRVRSLKLHVIKERKKNTCDGREKYTCELSLWFDDYALNILVEKRNKRISPQSNIQDREKSILLIWRENTMTVEDTLFLIKYLTAWIAYSLWDVIGDINAGNEQNQYAFIDWFKIEGKLQVIKNENIFWSLNSKPPISHFGHAYTIGIKWSQRLYTIIY